MSSLMEEEKAPSYGSAIGRRRRRSRSPALARRTKLFRGISFFTGTKGFVQHVSGSRISNINVNGTIAGTDTITQSSANALPIAIGFTFGDLDQGTSFAAIADKYRILKVVLRFHPSGPMTSQNTTGTVMGAQKFFATALDYDDLTTPSNLSYVQQYDNCQNWPTLTSRTKPFSRTIYPRTAESVFLANGSQASAVQRKAPWLDMAQPTVVHFGFKGYIEQAGSAASVANWRIDATYYFLIHSTR